MKIKRKEEEKGKEGKEGGEGRKPDFRVVNGVCNFHATDVRVS